jgi:nicotinic acetylcholine receptor
MTRACQLILGFCVQEDQDWGFVAMVLDRLFLWIFTIASIVGTFAILCEAPALYDDTKPIDMELSSVARLQLPPSFGHQPKHALQ